MRKQPWEEIGVSLCSSQVRTNLAVAKNTGLHIFYTRVDPELLVSWFWLVSQGVDEETYPSQVVIPMLGCHRVLFLTSPEESPYIHPLMFYFHLPNCLLPISFTLLLHISLQTALDLQKIFCCDILQVTSSTFNALGVSNAYRLESAGRSRCCGRFL